MESINILSGELLIIASAAMAPPPIRTIIPIIMDAIRPVCFFLVVALGVEVVSVAGVDVGVGAAPGVGATSGVSVGAASSVCVDVASGVGVTSGVGADAALVVVAIGIGSGWTGSGCAGSG